MPTWLLKMQPVGSAVLPLAVKQADWLAPAVWLSDGMRAESLS
ncbi:MAG TPA: hypothetical protein VGY50_18090 [Streptosporangiaceae bacterium]|nr:hypothetical protein [Streptosporangiaceae bacterium]